jgi:hypothetical protein
MMSGERFAAILKAQKSWNRVKRSIEGYDWYIDRDGDIHSVPSAADMTDDERRAYLEYLGCDVHLED